MPALFSLACVSGPLCSGWFQSADGRTAAFEEPLKNERPPLAVMSFPLQTEDIASVSPEAPSEMKRLITESASRCGSAGARWFHPGDQTDEVSNAASVNRAQRTQSRSRSHDSRTFVSLLLKVLGNMEFPPSGLMALKEAESIGYAVTSHQGAIGAHTVIGEVFRFPTGLELHHL